MLFAQQTPGIIEEEHNIIRKYGKKNRYPRLLPSLIQKKKGEGEEAYYVLFIRKLSENIDYTTDTREYFYSINLGLFIQYMSGAASTADTQDNTHK